VNFLPLFIVTRDDEGLLVLPDGERCDTKDVPIGAMWRCECHKQQGWLIRVPGEARWPDGHRWPNTFCTLLGTDQGKGWDVSGEAPALTVTPSIWISPNQGPEAGEWHGFIRDGVIIDA